MFFHLDSIGSLARNIRRATKKEGAFPVLILPSAPASFRLIAILKASGVPTRSVGNIDVASGWSVAPIPAFSSPRQLWGEVARLEALPFIVALFEDQLISLDRGALHASLNGERYFVSSLVTMLRMKFGATFLVGHVEGRGCKQTLTTNAIWGESSSAMTEEEMSAFLGACLGGLLEAERDVTADWYAREVFQLKRETSIKRAELRRCQEMESIARMAPTRSPRCTLSGAFVSALKEVRGTLAKRVRVAATRPEEAR
jgi:hypothetical protein